MLLTCSVRTLVLGCLSVDVRLVMSRCFVLDPVGGLGVGGGDVGV